MIPVNLDRAFLDGTLTQRQLRVYGVLHDQLDYLDCRPVKLAWLGHRLHMSRGDVSRALTVLTKRGYLLKGPQDGQICTYRLSNTAAEPLRESPTRPAA